MYIYIHACMHAMMYVCMHACMYTYRIRTGVRRYEGDTLRSVYMYVRALCVPHAFETARENLRILFERLRRAAMCARSRAAVGAMPRACVRRGIWAHPMRICAGTGATSATCGAQHGILACPFSAAAGAAAHGAHCRCASGLAHAALRAWHLVWPIDA